MPNKYERGSVRRSQVITTYGVGSVVPVKDESVMIAGIDRWDAGPPDLHEPRLERQLGVHGFMLPPAGEGASTIPVIRFPGIFYCPNCRRLDRHSFFAAFTEDKCSLCRVPLVPSRFVVACSQGHIDDFPYFEWLHVGHPKRDTNHILRIDAGGVSAALRDILISCSCGVPERSMQGAFGRNALKAVMGHCSGRRPWLGDEVPCREVPRTLQRGASNAYFPVVRSAISIPPWSEGAFKALNRYWSVLKQIPESALAPTIDGMGLAKEGVYSVDDLVLAVQRRKESESGSNVEQIDMRSQEYEALVRGRGETSREQEFVCTSASMTVATRKWFDKIMLVKRLREVRVLESFTRLLPPTAADPPERRAPLAAQRVDWLPAIEVVGEGVFLRLDASRLAGWESKENVIQRVARIDARYKAKFEELGRPPDRSVTPRLVLLHTLAHLLIGEWSLASGYPAASLRERLYSSETMAGILVYTATSDSSGSLGGVISQANEERMESGLFDALMRAEWCSSDPLCIESEAVGTDSLNMAACHSCVLLPEVSCEESNVLLDRGLLVGTPDDSGLGFFRSLLDEYDL